MRQSSLGCVGASPLGSSSASDSARLTKPSGSQKSTPATVGPDGTRFDIEAALAKGQEAEKAREKHKDEQQTARQGRG